MTYHQFEPCPACGYHLNVIHYVINGIEMQKAECLHCKWFLTEAIEDNDESVGL